MIELKELIERELSSEKYQSVCKIKPLPKLDLLVEVVYIKMKEITPENISEYKISDFWQEENEIHIQGEFKDCDNDNEFLFFADFSWSKQLKIFSVIRGGTSPKSFNKKKSQSKSENSILTKKELLSIVEEVGLSDISKQLIKISKYSIKFKVKKIDDSKIKIGNSKMGGLPDLPLNCQYPDGQLTFLAQINLSEIRKYDSDKLLPEKGMIYFFYDADNSPAGYDPKHKNGFKVLFYDDESPELKRIEKSKDIVVMDALQLEFEMHRDIPAFGTNDVSGLILGDKDRELYEILLMSDNLKLDGNKLLGYPDNIQQADWQTDCALVTHGIYTGKDNYKDSPEWKDKWQEFAKEYDQWMLLLQIEPWGDGVLLFLIKKDDLKNKNFDNVWIEYYLD